MSYEVWTHDGARPELLTTAPDKGVARRAWLNSKHAVIVALGTVLESKTGTGDKQLKAIKLAAEYAHHIGGTPALEVLPPGPRSGTPRMVRPEPPPGSLTVERVEPMPPPREVPVVEADTDELVRLRRALHAVTVERQQLREQVDAVATERDTARRDAAAHLVRAIEAEAQRDAVTADRVTFGEACFDHQLDLVDLVELAMTEGLAVCESLRSRVQQLDEEVVLEGDRALRAEGEIEHLSRRLAEDYQRGLAEGGARGSAEAETVARQSAELSRHLAAAREAMAQFQSRPVAPTVDEDLVRRIAVQAATAAVRTDLRLRALAARVGGVDRLEQLVDGAEKLLRMARAR